jgi:preprotein translocase subunit Sec61beta
MIFKNKTEFSLFIEEKKKKEGFDSYIETLVSFWESDTDHEFESIVKMLNKSILDKIEIEASKIGMLKFSSKEDIKL